MRLPARAFVSLLVGLAAWTAIGCDPMLSMSQPRAPTRSIDGCEEAVAHLKECCPAYETYVSCAVYDTGPGAAAPADLSASQSKCVRARDCASIEKTIVSGKSLCGASLQGRSCR